MSESLVLILLFIIPLLSGMAVVFFKPLLGSRVKLLLAFSGAFLLSICFTHLLPEVFSEDSNTGYYVLAGFFIQVLLEFFSAGIEHGHIHVTSTRSFPYLVFLSLCLHALIEGFPLAGYVDHHDADTGHSNALLIGVLLHKIPIAIVLTTLLVEKKVNLLRIVIALIVFSLMAPMSILSVLYSVEIFQGLDTRYLTAVSIGIFLHISTVILFESSKDHQFNLIKFITVVLGILLAIFTFGAH